jgi:hypothetical protein
MRNCSSATLFIIQAFQSTSRHIVTNPVSMSA